MTDRNLRRSLLGSPAVKSTVPPNEAKPVVPVLPVAPVNPAASMPFGPSQFVPSCQVSCLTISIDNAMNSMNPMLNNMMQG